MDYRTVAVKIMAKTEAASSKSARRLGFVGWTAELIPDVKERCLISYVALERLAGLIREDAPL
jgi:hypothetical protein